MSSSPPSQPTSSRRFAWLSSLPPSLIAEPIRPETASDLVDVKNHAYVRIFDEWLRATYPQSIEQVRRVLLANSLQRRPTADGGTPWSDATPGHAHSTVHDLYLEFRDGALADVKYAMQQSGASRIRREFANINCDQLLGEMKTGSITEWLDAAMDLALAVSPKEVIVKALSCLSQVGRSGWSLRTGVLDIDIDTLVVEMWGLVDGELRKSISRYTERSRVGLAERGDAMALAEALQAYAELAEQTVVGLHRTCERALDWACEEAESEPEDFDDELTALTDGLSCAETSVLLIGIELYALTAASESLMATAVSAGAVRRSIGGMSVKPLSEHRDDARARVCDLLSAQFIAANDARQTIVRNELMDRAEAVLTLLPVEPVSRRQFGGAIERLQSLGKARDAHQGSQVCTFGE